MNWHICTPHRDIFHRGRCRRIVACEALGQVLDVLKCLGPSIYHFGDSTLSRKLFIHPLKSHQIESLSSWSFSTLLYIRGCKLGEGARRPSPPFHLPLFYHSPFSFPLLLPPPRLSISSPSLPALSPPPRPPLV